MGTLDDEHILRSSSSSDPGTVPADQEFFDTVTHHGREYQKYSIENGVYFCPVDEVRR